MMRENSILSGTEVLVGIIMGSDSDLPVMKASAEILETFNVAYEVSKFHLYSIIFMCIQG